MALRRLAIGVIGLATLVVVVLAAGFFGSTHRTSPAPPSVSFEDLKHRGVIHLEKEHVIFVHHEGDVFALSDDAQHIGDTVTYCKSSGLFESEAHAEKFDITGRYFAGPAMRGLDRYEVSIEDDLVIADLEARIEGPSRGRSLEPLGRYCV